MNNFISFLRKLIHLNTKLALISFIFLSCIAFAQNEQPGKLNRDTLLAAAHEIIEAARYCALITTSPEGEIHVRTMDPFSPDDDMVIWFGTNINSRKVSEIKKNPKVTVYYAHPKGSGYAVFSGKAQIVDGEKEKSKRWKEEWTQYYPEREKNYILIKVVPEKMEVLYYPLGIGNDPETWLVPSLEF